MAVAGFNGNPKNIYMIIDSIQNASRYYSVHPLFTKAFEYILKTDLKQIPLGRYAVEGVDIRAIFSNDMGVTAAASCAEFECHNQHIDIQLIIDGVEEFGWKPRETCVLPDGHYNPEKDLQIFKDAPDMFFKLTNGQFVILFPEDVHAPMIGNDRIKKLVMKVKKD